MLSLVGTKAFNIPLIPKAVKKDRDWYWISLKHDPNCFLVVVLKNCVFKEILFSKCWKVSSVNLVFKNVEESSMAKNYCLASFLPAVTKLDDCLEKSGFFLISSKTFHSMVDFLSVASDRIIMVLIDAGLLELQNLIYPELLTGFGTQVFITNSSFQISDQIFNFVSLFLNERQYLLPLHEKSL